MILVAIGLPVFLIAFLAKKGRIKAIKTAIRREYNKHYSHMAEHTLNTKIYLFAQQCQSASYDDADRLYNEADKIILYAKKNTTKANKTARKLYNILSAWELNLNQIQLA